MTLPRIIRPETQAERESDHLKDFENRSWSNASS